MNQNLIEIKCVNMNSNENRMEHSSWFVRSKTMGRWEAKTHVSKRNIEMQKLKSNERHKRSHFSDFFTWNIFVSFSYKMCMAQNTETITTKTKHFLGVWTIWKKSFTRDENGKLTDSAQHCLLTKLIKRKSITRNEKKMKQKTKGIVSKN